MTASRPPGFKMLHRRLQPAFQRTRLIVHRHPQRLKHSRGRMRFFPCRGASRSINPPNCPWFNAATPDHAQSPARTAANPVRPRIPKKSVPAPLHPARSPNPPPSAPAANPCAYPAGRPAENSIRVLPIQLRRTHAQVQKHSVATPGRNPSASLRKISAPQSQTAPRIPPTVACAASTAAPSRSHQTAIHSGCSRQHGLPRVQPHRSCRRRTSARTRPQRFQHFRDHHRLVNEVRAPSMQYVRLGSLRSEQARRKPAPKVRNRFMLLR